jgi:hypothetical protein
VPANYGSIGTYGSAFAHVGFGILLAAVHRTARVGYVGKHHRRAQKHVVVTGNACINRYVVLHLYIIAQHHAGRNYYVLPEVAFFTEGTIRHYMRKVPDFGSGANGAALVYYCGFVSEIVHVLF